MIRIDPSSLISNPFLQDFVKFKKFSRTMLKLTGQTSKIRNVENHLWHDKSTVSKFQEFQALGLVLFEREVDHCCVISENG